MDRDQLIRAHFDAYSDLVWVTDLEPKFRPYNLDTAQLKEFRQAWNRHTEARDWSWWLENVKSVPDAKLQQEIAECRAEIAAFRKEPDTERQRFQRILDGKASSRTIQRESKDHERDR